MEGFLFWLLVCLCPVKKSRMEDLFGYAYAYVTGCSEWPGV